MTSGFEKSGTVLTVHLPAELDHPASDEIRRDSDRIIGHNYIKNMIFDFSETVFMDSSGIGAVLGRYKRMCERDGDITLYGMNRRTRKLLEMAGVGKLAAMYEKKEEALKR